MKIKTPLSYVVDLTPSWSRLNITVWNQVGKEHYCSWRGRVLFVLKDEVRGVQQPHESRLRGRALWMLSRQRLKSTQMDRTTGQFGLMIIFLFFIYQPKDIPEGFRCNACSRKWVRNQPKSRNEWRPLKRSIFSNSPLQEVLNFLHNLFASKSLSYFFLYPINFMPVKSSLSRKENSGF